MNLSNISGETNQEEIVAVTSSGTPEEKATTERLLEQKLDSHYAQLFASSARVSSHSVTPSLNRLPLPEVEEVSGAPRRALRSLLPANRFQRTFLLATTACLAVGFCSFFAGSWPAFSNSDSSAHSRNTELANETEYSQPADDAAQSPLTPTSVAQTPFENSAANSNDSTPVNLKAARQESTRSGSAAARVTGAPVRSERTTPRQSSNPPLRTVALPPMKVVSTPASSELEVAQPAAAQSIENAASQPQETSAAPTGASAFVRASAHSNPQLGGGISSGGRPLGPRSGDGDFVSVRRGDGSTNYEEKRLTQAIDAGGRNGRDLAGLYQQRALLYLNQGDSDRAVPDFQKAIELFSAMIQRHDRIKEAQEGLQASKNGLKIASKTQVF